MACNSIVHACSFGGYYRVVKHQKKKKQQTSCHLVTNTHNASSFAYTLSETVPLVELPEASFDQYMEDKGRVIRAIIPERATTQHLIREEWRIRMPAVRALFQEIEPIIDVRVISKHNGEDYPPHIPPHIPKLYEVHTTKWDLRGLPADYMPPFLNFKATATLYPERQETHSFINNQIDININVVFPPILLAILPNHVLHNFLDSFIRKFVDDIKIGYTARLVADYSDFKINKLSEVSV